MTLKAIGNYIVIQPHSIENPKDSLIIRVDVPVKHYGKVVSIGDKVQSSLKVGDIVFLKFFGQEIIHNEELYYACSYESILAILED